MKFRLWYALFCFGLCVTGVAVLEYALLPRYSPSLPRKQILMGFYAAPGETFYGVHANQLGYTGEVLTPTKSKPSLRILTLGGSAFSYPDVAAHLQQHFQKETTTPIKLLGAALPTHTTRASLHKLRYFADYDFDIVLIYHGINDLWTNNYSSLGFTEDYHHIGPWYYRNVLVDNSITARLIYNNWLYPETSPIFPTTENENVYHFASEQTFAKNIQAIIAITKANGATPVLITFATGPHIERAETNTDTGKTPTALWGAEAFVREGVARHNAALAQVAKANNVLLIDFATYAAPHKEWFADICHLDSEGVEKMAGYLAQELAAKGLLE